MQPPPFDHLSTEYDQGGSAPPQHTMELTTYRPESAYYQSPGSVPRVGGGYATRHQIGHHAYKYGHHEWGGGVKPLEEPSFEESSSFDGHGVRHVVAVQGGACIWTSEGDGSLAVRSTENGEIRHTVQRADSVASEVTTMHLHGNHIWVGTSDGNIEVYEHLLAALLTTTKGQHELNVVAFAPTTPSPNNPSTVMFSLSPERVNKWGNEAETFCLLRSYDLTEGTQNNTACSIACSPDGRYVYLGGADGSITLCTADLTALGAWSAHPGASVGSLLYEAHVLISGGSEGELKIWEGKGEGGVLVYHDEEARHGGAVRGVVREGDASDVLGSLNTGSVAIGGGAALDDGHFVLLTLDDEKIRRWRWDGVDLHAMTEVAAHGLTNLSSYSCWRGMRLLSYGSNGRTVPWFSARNVSCDAMERTAAEMRLIIQQDNMELQKWQDLIDSVRDLDNHRLKAGLKIYQSKNLDTNTLLANYWRKLYGFMRKRKNQRHARRVRAMLQKRNDKPLMLEYFYKLKTFAAHSGLAKSKHNAAEHLLRGTDNGTRRICWNRWMRVTNVRRRSKRKDHVASLLLRNTNQGLLYLYYKKLFELKQARRMDVKARQASARLAAANEKDFISKYYYRWLSHHFKQYYDGKEAFQVRVLFMSHNRAVLRRYYEKLYFYAVYTKVRNMYGKKLALLLCTNREGGARSNENKMTTAFLKWREWAKQRKMGSLKDKINLGQDDCNRMIALQEKYKYPDLHAKEQRLSDRVDHLEKRKEDLQKLLNGLKTKNTGLNAELKRMKGMVKCVFCDRGD